MIRGTQKRMIVVKTADSSCFEEAYFLIRRDCSAGGGDMVDEANRIVEQLEGGVADKRSRKIRVLRGVALFVCGCGIGAALTAILMLLI